MSRLFLIVLAVFVFFSTLPAGAVDSYDQMVPADVMYYYSMDKNAARSLAFPVFDKAMDLWWDSLSDFLEWGIIKDEWTALEAGAHLSNGLHPLQGDSFAVAVTGFGDTGRLPAVLYLSNISDPKAADDALQGIFRYLSRNDAILHVDNDLYRGQSIASLYGPGMIPGLGLSYTFQGNLLLLSTSKPMLLEWIEDREAGIKSLSSDETYQAAVASLPSTRYSTAFFNFSEIHKALENGMSILKALETAKHDPSLEPIVHIADVVLDNLKNVKYRVSYQEYVSDEYRHSVKRYHIDPALAQTPFGGLLTNPPVPFAFQSYLPRRTGSFVSTNLLNLPQLWADLIHLATDVPELQKFFDGVKNFEAESQISMEDDLFSWMGDQLCLVRPLMDLDTVIPVNRAALLISVKDTAKAKAGLAKVQRFITDVLKAPVSVENQIYRNADLTLFRPPIPVIPFIPCVAITQDVIIFASHDALVREMLDVKAGAVGGIERNTYYRKMTSYLDQPGNGVSYQDLESEFYMYREALKRVSSITDLGKSFIPQEKFIPSLVMDRGTYLLSCLQFMKASVTTLTCQPEEVVTHNYLLLKDLPGVPSPDNLKRQKISLGAADLIAMGADFLEKHGDLERALRWFSKLAEYAPDKPDYLLHAADIAKKLGNTDQAKSVMQSLSNESRSAAFLIQLEAMEPHASAPDIIHWVSQESPNAPSVDPDAALLGIALQRRDKGETDLARGLLEHLKSSSSPAVQSTAAREGQYLENGAIDSMVSVPLITLFPSINGVADDANWQEGANQAAVLRSSNGVFTLRLSRSAAQLYGLLEGQAAVSDLREQNFHLYFCPARDYTRVVQISAYLHIDGDRQSTDQVMNLVGINPFGFPFDQQEEKSIDANWPVAVSRDENQWRIEFSLPLGVIRDQAQPAKDVWLFNVEYEANLKSGSSQTDWLSPAYQPDSQPAEPTNYLNLSLK